MDTVLVTPGNLNEFHTVAKFFLDKQQYMPTVIAQTSAVPSSALELLKDTIPKLSKNMITIHVHDSKFTTYGSFVTHMDVFGCIAFESHATSFKYTREANSVLYFDPHGLPPKPLITQVLKQIFNGCTIEHNTKTLQGRHGVCTLWAIWFCLLMSVSSCTLQKIRESTLDDTYMMCLNSLLYVSANKTNITQPIRKSLKTVLENSIVQVANIVAQSQHESQRCIIGSRSSNTINALLHNNNITFDRIMDDVTSLQKVVHQKKTIKDFIPLLDETMKRVVEQYSYIENTGRTIANCECSYHPYARVPWDNYVKVIGLMKGTFSSSFQLIKDNLLIAIDENTIIM